MAELAAGRFEAVSRLGTSRFAASYLALDPARSEPVVVRMFRSGHLSDERLATRARRVAAALGALDDHRIVTPREAGRDPVTGAGYLVRDFVEGKTASELIEEGLDLAAVLAYGAEVAEALAVVHRHGAVHGDLKPSNVIVMPNGELRIVDALAADVSPPLLDDLARLPSTGLITTGAGAIGAGLATLTALWLRRGRYGAPELARGAPPGPGSDLYSAGRLLESLAEAATGASQAGQPLRRLIGRLTASDPRERLQDAAALAGELRELQDAHRGSRARRSTGRPPRRVSGRSVNLWFEADERVPPLRAGIWYPLGIDIGPPPTGAVATEPFHEPDFGGRESVDVLVSLYSDELELERTSLTLTLPRVGATKPAGTSVCAPRAGRARLDLVLSALPELELLQALAVELDVVEVSSTLAGSAAE